MVRWSSTLAPYDFRDQENTYPVVGIRAGLRGKVRCAEQMASVRHERPFRHPLPSLRKIEKHPVPEPRPNDLKPEWNPVREMSRGEGDRRMAGSGRWVR